jgi:hypothetical protein
MSFRNRFAVLFMVLGLSAAAHAQFGAYGMYSVTHYSGVQCLTTAPINCTNGTAGISPTGAISTGHLDPTGGSGGVYYDFKSYGPVRLGVDVRGGANHANKSASGSNGGGGSAGGQFALAGIRASTHTPITWIKPYAQVSVGWARSNVTEPSCQTSQGGLVLCSGPVTTPVARSYDTFLQYEGFVGVDLRVASMLDFRAIEVGIGNMNRIGSGSPQDGSSSVGVKSLGAGVVLHLP